MVIDFHGLRLPCHPDSHSSSKAIYFSGLPDYREMRFMLDYLRPGDSFLDVGANVGLYTLLAISAIGATGHVHAFEPGEIPARRLQEAIDLNRFRNCTLHQVAASDVRGTASFDVTDDDCTAYIRSKDEVRSDLAQIETVRLDEVLADESFAMAKFDIEGFEPFAIRGASAMLRVGNPPVIQLEMAGYSKRHGISTTQFISELDAFGYECAYYEPETHSLHVTSRPWEVPVENVLAVHRRSRDEVTRRLTEAGERRGVIRGRNSG